MVSVATEIAISILTPLMTVIFVVGGVILYNRKKTDKLYQRLFGLEEDDVDSGYMVNMEKKLEEMDGKLDELNHQRIQDLEVQLEGLENELDELNKRITVEERSDDTEEE